ncbi:MazG family protein [Propionibacteriaceae bacterium Y1700]|uniref:MazG family protein n=1 Tax=Microlunatus sp. Y1700 TaxID=3418487 RepID=UPI003DA74FF1
MSELERLIEVMGRLRSGCPWDAEQTHRSLVTYLIEETCETVEAIETADDAHLREELGDLLLQVVFHATIAAERGAFTLDDVAAGISDKLISRHPYVFADEQVPDDLNTSWEQRKAAEKGRTSSLEGIPEQLSALARATKIIARARSREVPVALDETPIDAEELSSGLVSLVSRAKASGLDADQVMRDAVRDLEQRVRTAEAARDGAAGGSVGDNQDADPVRRA